MKKIKQMLHGDVKQDPKTKETNQINRNVIEYLMKNVYLQNKIQFYTNLNDKAIHHLITAAFRPNNMSHEDNIFTITLLKKHTFILNIAFSNQKFNYTDLFAFLQQPTLNYDLLSALEDIFIPFCKKFPHKVSQFAGKQYKHKIDFFEYHLYKANIQNPLHGCILLLKIIYEIIHLSNSIFIFGPSSEQFQRQNCIQYGQVSWNLKDFLSDLTVNLGSVQLLLVQRFVTYLNSEFIGKLFTNFSRFRNIFQYEDYCQGIIFFFINTLKLLETFKLSANSHSHEKDKNMKQRIQSMLCMNAIDIANLMPSLMQVLLEKNNKNLSFSSGETIQRVGMVKYRILELIQKIFSINQIQNLKVPFQKFDFFPVITIFLDRYKWNSIAHNLIVKITQQIISQDYKHFKLRYLQSTINPNKSLFGQFIIHFRNRKFVFLHSMRMMNQAHRSLIFQMQERNDLNILVQMFKIWKQYMQIDLLEYEEKNYEDSLCYDGEKIQKTKKIKYNENDNHQLDSSPPKPLQKFQQILISFKEEEKWSPKQASLKIKKQNLMDHEQIKRIDSMAYYLPPK